MDFMKAPSFRIYYKRDENERKGEDIVMGSFAVLGKAPYVLRPMKKRDQESRTRKGKGC